jgi:hypothetical protein
MYAQICYISLRNSKLGLKIKGRYMVAFRSLSLTIQDNMIIIPIKRYFQLLGP